MNKKHKSNWNDTFEVRIKAWTCVRKIVKGPRKVAEEWLNDYLLKMEATTEEREFMNLQTDNRTGLSKIQNDYPELAKVLNSKTEEKRASW